VDLSPIPHRVVQQQEYKWQPSLIRFSLDLSFWQGVRSFQETLTSVFADGLDVVIDYLWGSSAHTIIVAVAKAIEDAHPVRFIQVGGASGESLELPAAALRSSAIQIMGSGLKSVPLPSLLEGIRKTFDLAAQGRLHLSTQVAPLSTVTENWQAAGNPRLVFTLR